MKELDLFSGKSFKFFGSDDIKVTGIILSSKLFFNDKTEPIFKELELKAREDLKTDNVTDTVYELFKKIYGKNS